MNPRLKIRDRGAIGTSRLLPGLLLALLGLWSLAGMDAVGKGAPGTNASDSASFGFPASSATRAEAPALLHSAQRGPCLQTLQPSCKGEDGEGDDADGDSATGWPADARTDAALQGKLPPLDAGVRRPLHGLPQTPRAPPHLA
jgi:hypothetical protein